MRKEFRIDRDAKTLVIPAEIMERTGLKNAANITALGTDAGLLLMDEAMTPMEMAKTADMLHTAVVGLIDRLEAAGRAIKDFSVEVNYTPDGVSITIPRPLFENAGIPVNTPLMVDVGEGEIYVTEALESDDDEPLERVPEFLRDVLCDRGLPPDLLPRLFQTEEKFHE